MRSEKEFEHYVQEIVVNFMEFQKSHRTGYTDIVGKSENFRKSLKLTIGKQLQKKVKANLGKLYKHLAKCPFTFLFCS